MPDIIVNIQGDEPFVTPEMIDLAVIAYVRHRHTNYDELLMSGYERGEARSAVRDRVDEIRDRWRTA